MPRTLGPAEIDALLAGAAQFRSRLVVTATAVPGDRRWVTEGGDVLHAHAGDWWVVDGDKGWSVAEDVFAATYESVGGDRYRKTAAVTATQMDESFVIQTLEGSASGRAGDWLVRNPTGECWPIAADEFERRYTPT